jgi:hypothetical protein
VSSARDCIRVRVMIVVTGRGVGERWQNDTKDCVKIFGAKCVALCVLVRLRNRAVVVVCAGIVLRVVE